MHIIATIIKNSSINEILPKLIVGTIEEASKRNKSMNAGRPETKSKTKFLLKETEIKAESNLI